MTWPTGKTNPKYRTREHRAYLAELKRQLKEHGRLWCTAKTCVLPTRWITNPNGRQRDGLTAGHADNGVDYDGPQHHQCNVEDGARRARAARRRGTPRATTSSTQTKPKRWEL